MHPEVFPHSDLNSLPTKFAPPHDTPYDALSLLAVAFVNCTGSLRRARVLYDVTHSFADGSMMIDDKNDRKIVGPGDRCGPLRPVAAIDTFRITIAKTSQSDSFQVSIRCVKV